MKRRLVFEGWAEFEAEVMPKDAPPIQHLEMRRAFYGGASSLLSRLMQCMSSEGEAIGNDLDMIDDVQREFRDFAQDVLDGKA